MALKAGYYGIKKNEKNKMPDIVSKWDNTVASIFTQEEEAITGAVNFCPMFSDYTKNGVTFDVDDNGVMSISGTTATADTNNGVQYTLKKGSYYLLGAPEGSELGSYDMYIMTVSDTTIIARDYDGSTENSFTLENDASVYVAGRVKAGAIDTTKKFKPMIALSNYAVYAPFAKTNAVLTSDVVTLSGSAADQKTAINAIITAATEAADFAAFKTAMGAITPVTRSVQAIPEVQLEEQLEEQPVEKKKTTKKITKVEKED